MSKSIASRPTVPDLFRTHYTFGHASHWLRCALIAAIGLLAACSSDSSDRDTRPYAEILGQGVDRYLGTFTPMSSEEADGVVTHRFDSTDGPICLDGSNYEMATQDVGTGDLMIFLEGGGGCWSTLCQATKLANADGINGGGILDKDLETNPLRRYNTGYLPYCDGGLFSSDKENVDFDGDGLPEYQRGLRNLSASLDVIQRTFPAPRRIVLTGNSGGGFGTIFALPLVRTLYPDVPIDVINDSGIGIGVPDDPSFQELLQSDWNNGTFFPASICPECYANGHSTAFLDWQLKQDSNVRLSLISSKQDFVIGTAFLRIFGPAFEAALLPELARLEADNPSRVRSFVPDGAAHTFVQRELDATAGGVVLFDWISAMLDDTEAWVTTQD